MPTELTTPEYSAGRCWTIEEWCVDGRISEGSYFKERKQGRAPRSARVGRRVVIIESPQEYFRRAAR